MKNGPGSRFPFARLDRGPLDRPIRDEGGRPRHGTDSARGARQRYGLAAALQGEPEAAC